MTKYAVTEAAEKRKATVGVETNGGFTHFTPELLGWSSWIKKSLA